MPGHDASPRKDTGQSQWGSSVLSPQAHRTHLIPRHNEGAGVCSVCGEAHARPRAQVTGGWCCRHPLLLGTSQNQTPAGSRCPARNFVPLASLIGGGTGHAERQVLVPARASHAGSRPVLGAAASGLNASSSLQPVLPNVRNASLAAEKKGFCP